MLNARRFRDKVELFSATETTNDLGKGITTYTSQGTFPAQVDVMTGTRALYYQEKGFGNPVTILLRGVSFNLGKIVFQSKTIYPRSIVKCNDKKESDSRGNYLIIEGNYVV